MIPKDNKHPQGCFSSLGVKSDDVNVERVKTHSTLPT